MRKGLWVGLVALGMAMGTTGAWGASFITFDSPRTAPVYTELRDGDSDGVALSVQAVNANLGSSGLPEFGTLSYKFDDANTWTPITDATTTISGSGGDILDFRLSIGGTYYLASTNAKLTYSGSRDGQWNSLQMTFPTTWSLNIVAVAGSTDRLAPVPIPAAVLLLGSGLAGLGLFGRRKRVG